MLGRESQQSPNIQEASWNDNWTPAGGGKWSNDSYPTTVFVYYYYYYYYYWVSVASEDEPSLSAPDGVRYSCWAKDFD